MKKVLFVCAGNVARSQIAEAYYNAISNSEDAISAGVLDFTPTKYGSPIEEVIAVMKEEGIDISKKKVKLVTRDMTEQVAQIFVLCPEEKVPTFVTNRKNVVYWEIKDPFGSSIENFRAIRDQIKERIQTLLTD